MKPATADASSAFARCTVAGADKLPAELGGADGVCRAIGQAAGPATAAASVDIRVLGPHGLAATLTTADGHILPEQQVSTSDRTLHAGSLAMLGRALATQLAERR